MLQGMHHVAIVVRSMDQALQFYRDALGLPVSKDAIIPDQGVRGVLLAVSNIEIELLEPISEGTGIARYLETQGEGLHHICFRSDSVAADLSAAASAGQEMIDVEPRSGLAGMIGFIHPKSNHSVLVELAQPQTEEPPPTPVAASDQNPAFPLSMPLTVVAVRDLAASAQTFVDHFGMRQVGEGQANVMAGPNKYVQMQLGDHRLELLTPVANEPATPLTRRLERGEGLFMIGFAVRDFAAAVPYLKDRGIGSNPPAVGDMPVAILNPEHTNGVLIFLTQARD